MCFLLIFKHSETKAGASREVEWGDPYVNVGGYLVYRGLRVSTHFIRTTVGRKPNINGSVFGKLHVIQSLSSLSIIFSNDANFTHSPLSVMTYIEFCLKAIYLAYLFIGCPLQVRGYVCPWVFVCLRS